MKLAILLAVAALTTSARAWPGKAAPTAICQTSPQWFINDAQGRPATAVFVCFGDGGVLLYRSRPLTFDEITKLIASEPKPEAAPAAPAKKAKLPPATLAISSVPAKAEKDEEAAPAPVASADPCTDLDGAEYTVCRLAQHAAPLPGDGLKPVK